MARILLRVLVSMLAVGLLSERTIPIVGTLPNIPVLAIVVTGAVIYISLGGIHTLWLAYHTLNRDVIAGIRYLKIKLFIRWAQNSDMCVADLFERNVATNPDKVALIFEEKQYTYRKISDYSNKVGNMLASLGLKKGDCVALVMTNRPEYVAIWLGASKIGAVTALINYNLRHKSLYHCIAVAKASVVICGDDLQEAVQEIKPLIDNVPIFVAGSRKIIIDGAIDMDQALLSAPSSIPPQLNHIHFEDKILYIYTSGTTGLPKAAIITNARFMFFSGSVHHLIGMSDDDILYNPLPLYHTAGGMVGMGQVILFNCAMVIRSKFSVSQYWPECIKYGCTVGQYVGEICRYLLNSPPKPTDTQHKVKVMFGNGVRPQIWEQFTQRFNMPKIAEFYGATESNANIMNYEGKPGACGFLSMLFPEVYPVQLIRVDEATGEPLRGPDGLCIVCKPGEPGEFIGKIKKEDPLRQFSGYADDSATQKKIVRDVFSKGDMAFLSGDILECDELGYVYFRDRMGDTFRWRGENVSTTEVEGQVSLAADHADAVVFGVEVPGTEGKAGMAVIVKTPESSPLNLEKFMKELKLNLPPYAMPLFIRVVSNIDTTGTFKLKKLDLQKEGYNLPKLLKDEKEDGHSFYFLKQKEGKYVPMTPTLLQNILDKEIGL